MADRTRPIVERSGPQQNSPRMLQISPPIARPLVAGTALVPRLVPTERGGIAPGIAEGGALPRAAANSGKVLNAFQGPSPKRAIVWALARPSAIHCRSWS